MGFTNQQNLGCNINKINMNAESPYYIIEFHDGMQLIPHTWLHVSKNKAYWSNFTNIMKYDKAVQYMEPVGKDWMLYDVVRILGSAREQEFRRFVVENTVNTKLSLKRIENTLTEILTRMDTSNILQKEDCTSVDDMINEFPIKDSETLQTVEHRLKTNESYKHSVIKMLSIVGGNNLKSIITNILTRTLTNSVAAEYSWFGGKKKRVFSNLYLWKIILSVVRLHIPRAVETEISQHIKIWLAHATERLQREEKKSKNVALLATNKETTPTVLDIALRKDIIISDE